MADELVDGGGWPSLRKPVEVVWNWPGEVQFSRLNETHGGDFGEGRGTGVDGKDGAAVDGDAEFDAGRAVVAEKHNVYGLNNG